MDKQLLWERITQYEFDEPNATLTFAKRLARDNHWSLEFAHRCIEEYRKFCFLCTVDGPCTPSDIVDQCWHQHLIYTRQYWQVWCKNVLGMELHHGPTLGGKQEGDKFDDWYSHTKTSYLEHFGTLPPQDIWPDNDTRFTRQFITLDPSEHLIVKVSDYPWLCSIMVALLSMKHYFLTIKQKLLNVKNTIKIAIIAMLIACAGAINAQHLPSFSNQAVLDEANILTSQQEAQLNKRISEFEDKTSMEIRLVTVANTTPALTASAYAEQLYHHWKLGDKNKNNGLLLVIAQEIGSPSNNMKDYCRIMTGYGTQTIVSDDVVINEIKHKHMMPNLPHQPYRAFSNALDKLFEKIDQWRQDHPEDNTVQQTTEETSDGMSLWLIIILVIVGGVVVFVIIGAMNSSTDSSTNYYSSSYNNPSSSSSDKKKKKDKDSGSSCGSACSSSSSNSSSSSWWSSSGSGGCSSSGSSGCGSSGCGGGGCGGGGCGS